MERVIGTNELSFLELSSEGVGEGDTSSNVRREREKGNGRGQRRECEMHDADTVMRDAQEMQETNGLLVAGCLRWLKMTAKRDHEKLYRPWK